MKGKIVPKIVAAVIAIIMIIPIITDVISNTVLEAIEYKDLEETVAETSGYKFSLVYVAPSDAEDIKDSKKEVKDLVESYASVSSDENLRAYYLDSNELTSSELNKLFGEEAEDYGYLIITNGEVLTTISGKLNTNELTSYVETYSANEFSPNLKNFKVAEDADAYKKLVKQKNTVTMAVFGRDTCFYCNQFKLVYNVVAAEQGLDIYYFDSDSYDDDEYDTIINDLGLKIPAACSSTGEEVDLQNGFDTPLTLFTKNGKVIDCISGYINKASLVTKLETVGMIETEEAE